MARTALHLKVELDHRDDEKPEKLAAEICRQLLKLYGVESAEVSNIVTEH
jgi:phosphoribosylformylglycinamidine (FGAM) synthase PurS component